LTTTSKLHLSNFTSLHRHHHIGCHTLLTGFLCVFGEIHTKNLWDYEPGGFLCEFGEIHTKNLWGLRTGRFGEKSKPRPIAQPPATLALRQAMMRVAKCVFKGRAGKTVRNCENQVYADGICEAHYHAVKDQKASKAAFDRENNLKGLRSDLQKQHEQLLILRQQQQQKQDLSTWLLESVRNQQQSLCRGLAVGDQCSAAGGTPYNAVTTSAKMQTPGFDLHQRIAESGFLVVQSAFNPEIVNCAAVVDRVALHGKGAFEEIVNDEIESTYSQRSHLPAATLPAKETSSVQRDTNERTRKLVDDAERYGCLNRPAHLIFSALISPRLSDPIYCALISPLLL
jgi:hypothetical protein